MQRLRRLGIKITLGNFGTGYSSLSLIRRVDFHKIKIDSSFIKEIGANKESEKIVEAIIGLAKSCGMTAAAECVEAEDQLSFLKRLGCDQAQGTWCYAPMRLEKIMELVAGKHS